MFAAVFAVARMLEKKYVRVLLWLGFAASVHPLMWVFPFSFCALWFVLEKIENKFGSARLPSTERGRAGMSCPGVDSASLRNSLRPITRRRNCTRITTSRIGSGMSGWGCWLRWGCCGGFRESPMAGRIANPRQPALLSRVCRAFVIYGADLSGSGAGAGFAGAV